MGFSIRKRPKMRRSIRKGDPGYDYEKAVKTKIFVNGKMIFVFFTADEEEGIAYCYERGLNGDFVIEGDHIKEVEVKGRVRIALDGQ